MSEYPSGQKRNELFLPDFCGLRMVFAVVILAELFAFILVLAGPEGERWSRLGYISLFMLWAGLSGAAVLCALKRQLAQLSNQAAAATSYLLLVLIIAVLSEVTYQIAEAFIPSFFTDHIDFLWRTTAIGAIVSGLLLRYFYVQHRWKQQVRSEAEARFEALQARIRPHFLFNSLNTIAALTHDDPSQAEEAMEDLADLFRAGLKADRPEICFAEELELTKRYVHLEQLRLGWRLRVDWGVDSIPRGLRLPPLVLQPLVENAIYHGIEPNPAGGSVAIVGEINDGCAVIGICNPKGSNSPTHQKGNHMALENIRQRLAARYEDAARLEVSDSDEKFEVKLTIPLGVVADACSDR